MQINLDISNEYHIVNISGEIYEYDDLLFLQKKINEYINRNFSLAVNVSEAEYINSGIIGLFVHWHKLLEAKGRTFCLVEPRERMTRAK